MSLPQFIDDMDGKFVCRLREYKTVVRGFSGKEALQLTSKVGIFEADFNFDVLRALERQSFLAVRRRGFGDSYMVYEVVDVKPTHYESAPKETGLPRMLRIDFLRRIDESWGDAEGRLENWIEITGVYTGYVIRREGGGYVYEWRPEAVPLVGAEAYLLSPSGIQALVSASGGEELFSLKDLDIPINVDLEALVKYHVGVFGFTGGGKSNLTAFTVRRLLESIDDLKVVVIDIAGEYSIGLADVVLREGRIYTYEDINSVEAFLASQAIPDTLGLSEEELNVLGGMLLDRVATLGEERADTLGDALRYVIDAESKKPEAGRILLRIRRALNEARLDMNVNIGSLPEDVRGRIMNILREWRDNLMPQGRYKATLIQSIEYAIEAMESVEEDGVRDGLIDGIAGEGGDRLHIFYVPDPGRARRLVSWLIEGLFRAKKRRIGGPRILFVLDEAQEFIPDRVRKEDYTEESNRAVERLLRQGRKYGLHCWVATQRLAHLNTNALQQIHTYFVNVLPRTYDRGVVADAVGISPDIVDRTANLSSGEWLLVSHKALARRGVAVFIRAQNNEEILVENLRDLFAR